MRRPPLPQLPEELRGRRVLMLRALYVGGAADAERLLAPLRAAAGPALMDALREMTFAELATTAIGPPPPPMASENHFDLFETVPDAVLDAAVAADGPVSAVELRHWGGAMARPPEGSGPIGHRDVPFSVAATAMVQNREQLPAARAGVDELAAALRPHATGGTFLNFLTDPARTATAYTPEDYRRLAAVKQDYDPENVFGAHHNIPPS
jgi:hypothetical protein